MRTFKSRLLCVRSRDRILLFFRAFLAFTVATTASIVAANQVVTGTGGGTAPHVKAFNAVASETSSVLPYGGGTTAGVRVAAADVTGDGTPDIVTGLRTASHVKVFSGVDQSEVRSFLAYGGAAASGGVYVAAGDVNGDTYGDIITGAGSTATHVKVFSGATNNTLQSFFAYPGVASGVRVAAGDVDGDGRTDIVTGLGEGFASHVKVFSGANQGLLHSFIAYGGGGFMGGVYVAAGDVNGDTLADIITGAGVGGGTHVKVFSGDGSGELASFFAYPGVNNEVRVGAGDVNGDGYADIITGLGSGNASHVKVFSGASLDPNNPLMSFFAYGSYLGGTYVAGVTPVSRVPLVPECSTLTLACIGLLAAGSRTTLGRRR
jgi:serralysin